MHIYTYIHIYIHMFIYIYYIDSHIYIHRHISNPFAANTWHDNTIHEPAIYQDLDWRANTKHCQSSINRYLPIYGRHIVGPNRRPIPWWLFHHMGNTSKISSINPNVDCENLWKIPSFAKSNKNLLVKSSFHHHTLPENGAHQVDPPAPESQGENKQPPVLHSKCTHVFVCLYIYIYYRNIYIYITYVYNV